VSENLAIKSYKQGDEYAILKLFEDTFGKQMSMDYWQWRFMGNPTRKAIIDMAWDNDVLASHYSVSPVILSVQGMEYTTGLSGTTMTHPDYRRRALFPTLAERTYARMASEGMAMVWGFPNNTFSHRRIVRDLEWEDIHLVPNFRKLLTEGRPFPEPTNNLIELANVDARFDLLWSQAKGKYRILAKRDMSYLNWRYERNPMHEYTLFGHVTDDLLLGYAICKHYLNDIDLVDILSMDDAVGFDLVCGVAKWATARKAEAINMWLNFTTPLYRKLEGFGFYNGEPITYFGGRILQSKPDGSEIYNFKNWHLTMGDSDVY